MLVTPYAHGLIDTLHGVHALSDLGLSFVLYQHAISVVHHLGDHALTEREEVQPAVRYGAIMHALLVTSESAYSVSLTVSSRIPSRSSSAYHKAVDYVSVMYPVCICRTQVLVEARQQTTSPAS